MTSPPPDQQQRAGRCPDDGAAADTFTLRPPRWLFVLFSRNPLIRLSDRVEALALVLTVGLSLLAVPIAGAAGTAIHDSRTRLHAEQAQSRSTVTATVIDSPGRSDATRVQARWFAAGNEHTGTVQSRSAPKPGETIDIVVNRDGSYAGQPPLPAAREAVLIAVAIWLNVTAAAAAVFAGTRAVLNRTRRAGWRPELASRVHQPPSEKE